MEKGQRYLVARRSDLITLSIIVATSGRATLAATLASLTKIGHGDEILVVRRDNVAYGNATRDETIPRCLGSHLWWMDDDDVATDDALQIIRDGVEQDPSQIHVFRMRYAANDAVLWNEAQTWACGAVGGTMCVVPNVPGKLGSWVHPAVHCGDWHFLEYTNQFLGGPPVWHEEEIAIIRPHEAPA